MDTAISAARVALKARRQSLNQEQGQLVIESAVFADEELARGLGEAANRVGEHGTVLIEEAQGEGVRLEPWEGMRFDRGWLATEFVTDEQENHCLLENCLILIHAGKLEKIDQLAELMKSVRRDELSLLLIATDFSEAAAAGVILARRYRHQICAIKAPGFGDRQMATLEDIAIRSGGQSLHPKLQMSLDEVDRRMLGRAERVIVEQGFTSLRGLGGSQEAINNRIQQIKSQMERTTSDYDREKLLERLANLTGDALIMKVGGGSEDEITNRAARARSAWAAYSHARSSGVVPGGGAALMLAYDAVVNAEHDEDLARRAFQAVAWALVNPVKSLVENRAGGGQGIVELSRETSELSVSDLGRVTQADGETLDPWFVVDCALRTSWAEARLLLDTTHWDISPEPEDEMGRRLR